LNHGIALATISEGKQNKTEKRKILGALDARILGIIQMNVRKIPQSQGAKKDTILLITK